MEERRFPCCYCRKPITRSECAGITMGCCLSCLIKKNIEWKQDILWKLRVRLRKHNWFIQLVNKDDTVDETFDVSGLSWGSICWLVSRIPDELHGQHVRLKEERK